METITLKANTEYYMHNPFAGSFDVKVNDNKFILNNFVPKSPNSKSSHKCLTKIITDTPSNIDFILGGYKVPLVSTVTECHLLFPQLVYHDVILKNTNDFDVTFTFNYDDDSKFEYNQDYVGDGFVGNVQFTHASGMAGFK